MSELIKESVENNQIDFSVLDDDIREYAKNHSEPGVSVEDIAEKTLTDLIENSIVDDAFEQYLYPEDGEYDLERDKELINRLHHYIIEFIKKNQ